MGYCRLLLITGAKRITINITHIPTLKVSMMTLVMVYFDYSQSNVGNLVSYFNPFIVFRFAYCSSGGVAIQNLEIGRVLYKRKSMAKFLEELKPVNKKIGTQLFKDYVFFPLIAGPAALPVLTGNLVANGLRNIWTFTIIFLWSLY